MTEKNAMQWSCYVSRELSGVERGTPLPGIRSSVDTPGRIDAAGSMISDARSG